MDAAIRAGRAVEEQHRTADPLLGAQRLCEVAAHRPVALSMATKGEAVSIWLWVALGLLLLVIIRGVANAIIGRRVDRRLDDLERRMRK